MDFVSFVETSMFSRDLPDYLIDDEYRQLQAFLIDKPERGDVIEGTGGLRKIRWSQERSGKGKRGGARVIFFFLASDREILMVAIYDKGTRENLSPADKKAFKRFITTELQARAAKRGAR